MKGKPFLDNRLQTVVSLNSFWSISFLLFSQPTFGIKTYYYHRKMPAFMVS